MKNFRILGALALAAACATSSVEGAVIYVLDTTSTTANRLVSFNSATPGTLLTDIALTGLAPAGQAAAEQVIGIDFRPSNGLLYGYATNGGLDGRVVQIDTATGAVTSVGGTTSSPNGNRKGLDFDPIADQIRTVTNGLQSRRYSPVDGTLISTDTPPAYAPGDPNVGLIPQLRHAVYSNNVANTIVTTLYGIDVSLDVLVRIGGVDGNPTANGGLLTTIGAMGIDAGLDGGFDIDGATGIAYFTSQVGGVSKLVHDKPEHWGGQLGWRDW